MKLKNYFRIRRISRSVHSGRGFMMGDGVDIEDRVIEFGRSPNIWFQILLGIKIITDKNEYHYKGIGGKYIWISKDNELDKERACKIGKNSVV